MLNPERKRFELLDPFGSTVFKTAPLNHSGISPWNYPRNENRTHMIFEYRWVNHPIKFWSEKRISKSRHLVPKTSALPLSYSPNRWGRIWTFDVSNVRVLQTPDFDQLVIPNALKLFIKHRVVYNQHYYT